MQNLMERLKALDLEALLLVNDSNIRYLSQYTGSDSFLLLLENKKYFITDYRYTEQAEQECPDYEVVVANRETETHEQVIAQLIDSHNLSKVGFEALHASYKLISSLEKEVSSCQLVPTERVVEDLRAIKSDDEIANISKAAAIADLAFGEILESIKEGVSETELTWELENRLRDHGSQGSAFPIILISGQKTSMPHGIPSDKKIEKGDFITLDFGALYNGYRSDMTRTVILGKPDVKQSKVYEIVREVQSIGVDRVKEGIPGRDVNQAVNDAIAKHNYLEFAGKGLGHGLGLDIHEIPFLNARCKEPLKAGNAITIEPGIYIPFWGGVRIEDTVVVTREGCEILTKSPKDLTIL